MTAGRGVRLRLGVPEDANLIAELAALEGAHPPPAPLLVAEADGEVRAVLSLLTGAVIADPGHHTATLVGLLRERASELTG